MPLPLSSDDIIGSTSSRRSWISGSFHDATDVFRRYSDDDDEEEGNLKWAVLEKLPTYDRMRKGNLRKEVENGKIGSVEIDSQNPGVSERKLLVEKILKVVEVDNEHFLPRLKSRIDQAGPELPMVEVRFEDLCVEADACVTERHIEYHKGFMVPRPQIPIWWRWYYRANPLAWTIQGLVISQPHDKDDLVESPGQSSMQVKEFLKEKLGFEHRLPGPAAAVHPGLVLIFIFVFAYSIKYLNFQKR